MHWLALHGCNYGKATGFYVTPTVQKQSGRRFLSETLPLSTKKAQLLRRFAFWTTRKRVGLHCTGAITAKPRVFRKSHNLSLVGGICGRRRASGMAVDEEP